jgi:hypothetical protein
VLRNEQRAERIGGIVGLPQSKRIRILLPVGIPADANHPRKEKLAFDKRVRFNFWQQG